MPTIDTATIFNDTQFQAFGDDGKPVALGSVLFKRSDNGVEVDTYTTAQRTAMNTRPVVLSASGKADIYVDNGRYDVIVRDANNLIIRTIEDFSPAISSTEDFESIFTLASPVIYVDTIANMLLIDGGKFPTVNVQDEAKGGIFNYDASQSAVNNGGTIIDGWIRQYSGPINVKWFGAKGDGIADDTVAIQAAIDFSYDRTLFFSKGVYKSNKLFITRPLKITGEIRVLYPVDYASTESSKILFSLVPDGEYCLTVAGTTQIIGLSISGISLYGNSKLNNGIYFNGTLTESITDSIYKDLLLYNFDTAISQTYHIVPSFESIRIQTCNVGINSNSQVNVANYKNVSIVSITGKALEMSNNEGAVFDSCNISNLSSSSAPITMFQSSAIFQSCYFENITSDDLMFVGAGSEVTHSSLVLNNNLKMGGRIIIGNSDAKVHAIGSSRDDVDIVIDSFSYSGNYVKKEIDTTPTSIEDYTEYYSRGDWQFIAAYNGAVLTNFVNRGYYRHNNTGGAATGGRLSAALEIGKVYTLIIAVREGATITENLRIKHGVETLTYPNVASSTEAPNIDFFPFVATATTLYLLWTGDIEVFGFFIKKGNVSNFSYDLLRTAGVRPLHNGFTYDFAPTEGTWKRGDKVYEHTPTASENIGWVCVVDGTPGTWKAFGDIAT